MNTVTIELEKYENLLKEIERLKAENAEKTIIKYTMPYPLALAILIAVIGGFGWVYTRGFGY